MWSHEASFRDNLKKWYQEIVQKASTADMGVECRSTRKKWRMEQVVFFNCGEDEIASQFSHRVLTVKKIFF